LVNQIVNIDLGSRSYPIYIGEDILQDFAAKFKEKFESSRAAVISNEKVWGYCGERIKRSLISNSVDYELILVPDGEIAKSLSVADAVYSELIIKGFERKDSIVALGGGVVGDLAGFVAATYERGIPYVQVPTTLLAQVDSSVGGKVAVNHALGKNMIGAFYQPSFVYIDILTLKTLSNDDFSDGLAEVVKYAFIKGNPLLKILLDKREGILARNADVLTEVVKLSCSIKGEIVEKDERDAGIRAFLNYGHTLGHAIESTTKYGFSHGQAVAIGMVFAAKLSNRLGLVDKDVVELHKNLIASYGLPTSIPSANSDELIDVMKRDKKRSMGEHVFVLLGGIGNPIVQRIDDSLLSSVLEEFISGG